MENIEKSRYIRGAVTFIIIASFLISLGYPNGSMKYYDEKQWELNYDIAEAVSMYTDYNDVCVSYTYVINNNPPMDISISEKLVYEIQSEEDIHNVYDKLPEQANLILVIDKNNIGSNDYVVREKTHSIEMQEAKWMAEGIIRYEDDVCALISIPR